MPIVPGLLSPYEAVRGFVYLPRLISKIRLHAAGQLPPDYVPNLGKGFDSRCCTFLRVGYADLQAHVLAHLAADDAALREKLAARRSAKATEALSRPLAAPNAIDFIPSAT